MKLLIKTNSSEGDINGGLDYGIIELNDEVCKLILKRAKAAQKLKEEDPSLEHIHFSDQSCNYLSADDYELDDKEEKALWQDSEPIEIKGVDEGMYQRIDCAMMVISSEMVWWQAYPHHMENSIEVTTEGISFSDIESFIGKGNAEDPERG